MDSFELFWVLERILFENGCFFIFFVFICALKYEANSMQGLGL